MIDPESEAAELIRQLHLAGHGYYAIGQRLNFAGIRSPGLAKKKVHRRCPKAAWWYPGAVKRALVDLGLITKKDLARQIDQRARQNLEKRAA